MPTFQNDPMQVNTNSTSAAVKAENNNQTDSAGVGVHAISRAAGVLGESATWHGVAGFSKSTTGGFGVFGQAGAGVAGVGETWIGVYGETQGSENGPAGIWGEGKTGGSGVKGHTSCPGAFGVAGFHMTNQGPGIFGKGAPAGRFEGNVEVTGDIRLTNGDCAEEFDVLHAEQLEPGTVMVFHSDGILQESQVPYDKRVAGIVSGAGKCKPAIVLDKAESDENRKIIALIGKVYCKVDAQYGSIEAGDLLTTSPTAGHAMKVADPQKAFGSVIGKAMCAVREGQTMIPVLVGLQ